MHAYAAATQAAGRSQRWQLQCRVSALGLLQRHQGHYAATAVKRKEKSKFTLFSDHNGSLLRGQPEATTAMIQSRQDVKTKFSSNR